MARPPKYKTAEERRASQLLQKRRSAQIRRREQAGIDLATPTEALTSGAAGPGAKATEDQVREIRRLRESEGWTYETLARQFGLSANAVRDICTNQSWKN